MVNHYQLYVDESYQADHYYVAGVLTTSHQKEKLTTSLGELAEYFRSRNGLASIPEFHGHAIMNGLDDWHFLKGKYGASVSIYQKVLHQIQNSGARIIIEGLDPIRLRKRYRWPDSPHEIALRHTLERVNEICSREGALCSVTADTLPDQDDFNEAVQGYTRVSTPGYRGQKLNCISGDISFMDSRKSFGIQAADMSAYIYRRHSESTQAKGYSKSSVRATARIYKAISPAIISHRKWLP